MSIWQRGPPSKTQSYWRWLDFGIKKTDTYEVEPSCHPICPVVIPHFFYLRFLWFLNIWPSVKKILLLTVKYSKTIETQVKKMWDDNRAKWDDNWVLPRTTIDLVIEYVFVWNILTDRTHFVLKYPYIHMHVCIFKPL